MLGVGMLSSMHVDVSARAVAHRTGIPCITVWLALRRILRCYPYKTHRYHELLLGDLVKWRAFAVSAFQKIAEDDDWLCKVLWTDEAHFTLLGSVNSHNCRFRATENPRTVLVPPLRTRKSRYGLDLTHLPLSGLFSSSKCVIQVS